jgi:sec-independent protein translocase protein TatB
MFGLTFDKLAIIAILAVFILGPERLPLYAGRLAELIRSLRDLTDSAKSRLKDELGPEVNDIDWHKLDPRQYDPRRIVREALADDTPAPRTTPSDERPEELLPPPPRSRAGSDGRYRRPSTADADAAPSTAGGRGAVDEAR